MRIRLTRALASGAVSTALLLAGAPLTGAGVAAASPRPQAVSHTASPQIHPYRRCYRLPGHWRWIRRGHHWIHIYIPGRWVCRPLPVGHRS